MDRKRVILIVASLLAAFAFYTIYQNTIILWDGYALEVSSVTDVEPELSYDVSMTDLLTYPEVRKVFDEARETGSVMVDEFTPIGEFEDLLESKGADLDMGYYYLELDVVAFMVSYTMYGGMEDTPVYMYLAGLMLLVALGLTVTGLQK